MLRQLGIVTSTPHDLRTGTVEIVVFLSEVAAVLNTLAVTRFGGRIGAVRQEGLVEQVVGVYLRAVGYAFPSELSVDVVEVLCMEVSAGAVRDPSEIAGRLQIIWRVQPNNTGLK